MPIALDEAKTRRALDEPATWPNLSQTASITGLSKGMLSRQAQAGKITSEVRGFGHGERILHPQEVLRIGCCYHRVSRETLIERFARFLTGKMSVNESSVRSTLRTLLELTERSERQTHPAAPGMSPKDQEFEAMPSWLLEVENLRANPAALKGTLSFTSADDLLGMIEVGPSIDEPAGEDPAAWRAVW